ncbi:MAG: radical SAM protein [Crocinitomicaceae bacterium]
MSNSQTKTRNITGIKKSYFEWRIKFGLLSFLFVRYKNPVTFFKVLKGIAAFKSRFTIGQKIPKLAMVDGKVYMNCNVSGFPNAYFFNPMEMEARKSLNLPNTLLEQQSVVQMALTKKCPLNCEHCFEGAVLNQKETLSLQDLQAIIEKLQNAGVPMIQFGGGEPMNRLADLLTLLKGAKRNSDFAIYTSGYKLNRENAFALKNAGLNAILLSIDHYQAAKHNAFRRNDKAFAWAMEAAKSAVEAKLVLTFIICVTREFCTRENLINYLLFAQEHGASFVELLEPRSVGNYEGMDVMLRPNELKILDDFFIEANTDVHFKHAPIVIYPGYQQRTIGCAGGGSKYLYIDTDGYMNACPYCRNKKTHILSDDHEKSIAELRMEGCELVENLA